MFSARYVIILNRTRMEALLVNSPDMKKLHPYPHDNPEVFELTKYIKVYTSEIGLSWSLDDTILIYATDTIAYDKLKGYIKLNFITYNKEAHYTCSGFARSPHK